MTVAPAYWISNSLQAIQDLLVACPTYATLGLSASNTYWQDVRSGELTTPYACLVMLDGEEAEDEAEKVPRRMNTVELYMIWPIANTVGDTTKDKTMRALNPFGQLLSEITAALATNTSLVRARRAYLPPSRTNDKDDQDAEINSWHATITFSWEI